MSWEDIIKRPSEEEVRSDAQRNADELKIPFYLFQHPENGRWLFYDKPPKNNIKYETINPTISPAPKIIKLGGVFYGLNFRNPISRKGFYNYLPLHIENKRITDVDEFLSGSDVDVDIFDADEYAYTGPKGEIEENYFRIKNQ